MLSKLVGVAINAVGQVVDAATKQPPNYAQRFSTEDQLKAARVQIEGLQRSLANAETSLQTERLAVERMQDNIAKLQAANRAQVDEVRILKQQITQLKQQHVATCESFAVAIDGPDATPSYEGDTVNGAWVARAVQRAEKHRHWLVGLRAAIAVLIPWVDKVLKEGGKDSDAVLSGGNMRGSVSAHVVRRQDLRVLRDIFEVTK